MHSFQWIRRPTLFDILIKLLTWLSSCANLSSGFYNGVGDYSVDGWDGGRGFGGRGRGRGRGRSFRGRGWGYGSQSGGYYDYGELEAPPVGRGKSLEQLMSFRSCILLLCFKKCVE